ncbi:MAG: glycoside hydrolase family 36 protein [Bacteroidota bacterium]
MVKPLLTTASGIQVTGETSDFDVQLQLVSEMEDRLVYQLRLTSTHPAKLLPLQLNWRQSCHNVKGVWSPNSLYEKRLRADWEAPQLQSRISVHAPVLCLFGHDDKNVLSFACSDVVNTIVMKAPVREEDNLIYCQIAFFSEEMPLTTEYKAFILVDRTAVQFGKTLEGIAEWWSSFAHLQAMPVVPAARLPVYSTWYSYHQNLSEEALLDELAIASKMGYGTLIVDDGWQTLDSNRGYDFTGDWQADRLRNMPAFVADVHALGMKCMIWFSVPFCGKKSQAYQRFKGKFLTENHRWAPVFDPRHPEVRQYLVDIYCRALKEWNIDGFKLDFIDDFRLYPETELSQANGRDCASVNEGVDRLMSEVYRSLRALKADVMIEFRQKYIGPAMRKFGNMFRAFDCPNDSVTNRLRTTDVKLLCGDSIVHSDMFTWHYEEEVEMAALQFTSILFSVPQLSVRLKEVSEQHRHMIQHYTRYWLSREEVLLDGDFVPFSPLANYPLLRAQKGGVCVWGVYEDVVVSVDGHCEEVDLVNGKLSDQIVIDLQTDMGLCQIEVFDCMGQLQVREQRVLQAGLDRLAVPAAGMAQLKKVTAGA